MSFGIDFGQKVDLTASIRNILRNYPEGTAILKELIQNADDAGARRVSFCLDMRHHGTETIAHVALAPFQGPAMLVYNDAIFTDEDFQSIQRIGDSLKRSSESSAKIGRFGIGFNAIYHLTELPSFARFLPNVNPSNPGKMIDFMNDKNVLKQLVDQFTPYEAYGLDWTDSYASTLFRLPLRTNEQSETSLLSKKIITIKDGLQLLKSLQQEAASMLLFLRYVQNIEIKVWPVGFEQPVTMFFCDISNMTSELIRQRALVSSVRPMNKNITQVTGNLSSPSSKPNQILHADYFLSISCKVSPNAMTMTSVFQEDSSSDAALLEYTESWMVCNQYGGEQAHDIANHPGNAMMRLVPWGGVAGFIGSSRSQTGDMGDEVAHLSPVTSGYAYCFLPLPVRSGLPVMVNGFFELSSNRRDLWQAAPDMTGDGQTRALWNVALMNDVIAPCYHRLLLSLRDRCSWPGYQSFWPALPSSLPAPFNHLASSFYDGSKLLDLLLVDNSRYALVNDPSISSTRVLGAAMEPRKAWIRCDSAVLLPYKQFRVLEDDTNIESLQQFLYLMKQNLVVCEQKFQHVLLQSNICRIIATPTLVRETLKTVSMISKQVVIYYQNNLVTFLLSYCMEGVIVNKEFCEDIAGELHNLPILPLITNDMIGVIQIFTANQIAVIGELQGFQFMLSSIIDALNRCDFNKDMAIEQLTDHSLNEWQEIVAPSCTRRGLFILCHSEDEQALFEGASRILIDRKIVQSTALEYLLHPSVLSHSNIRLFHPSLIRDVLRDILPAVFWTGKPVSLLEVEEGREEGDVSIKNFICKFWVYAVSHPDVIEEIANGVAIVPTRSGFLYPLSRMSGLLLSEPTQQQQQQQQQQHHHRGANSSIDKTGVREILLKLGAQEIDVEVAPSLKQDHIPPVFWNYIFDQSRSSVLDLIGTKLRSSGSQFDTVSTGERDLFFRYLSVSEPIGNLTEEEVLFIVWKLPIFTNFQQSPYTCLGTQLKQQDQSSSPIPWATITSTKKLEPALFPQHFLRYSFDENGDPEPHELELLRKLGVRIHSRASYFRHEFLPNIQKYFHGNNSQKALEVLTQLMSELTLLIEEDVTDRKNAEKGLKSGSISPSLMELLSSTSFLPSSQFERKISLGDGQRMAADSKTVEALVLYRPNQLFDPRNLELQQILPASRFPITELCREDILIFLTAAGLQSKLNLTEILECAKDIANTPISSVSDELDKSGGGEEDVGMTRAMNLLSYLDHHSNELLDENSQISSHKKEQKNASSVPSNTTGHSKQAPSPSIFNISSFFMKPTQNTNTPHPVPGIGTAKGPKEPEKPVIDSLQLKEILQELRIIPWVPTLTTTPHSQLPWRDTGNSLSLASPESCRLPSDAWLCSASMRLVAVPVHSKELLRSFGWDRPLPHHVVAIQIREISLKFSKEIADTSFSSDDESGENNDVMTTAREIFPSLLPQIYHHMHNAQKSDPEGFSTLQNILESHAWVWVGDRFVTPSRLAFNCSVNARPYLYQISQELYQYESLWKAFGVQQNFGPSDYVKVLRRMADETGASTEAVNSSGKASCQILSNNQLALALSIASILGSDAAFSMSGAITSWRDRDVYLPDTSGRLALAISLILDDVPWMAGPLCAQIRNTERMIHQNIAAKVAERVGVRSLRSILISRSVETDNIFQNKEGGSENVKGSSAAGGGFAEAFGQVRENLIFYVYALMTTIQAESLTNRLRTILDMYPDGSPILSELIQNADDAGASTVRVLLDENLYGTESLLGGTMSPLQGPALLFYNDAVFSESDYRSLARIGQGSKLEKLATTGRFGLGFNAVYHLTDSPSFISKDNLVMFDPHTSFIPGATASQPGLRIRLIQRNQQGTTQDVADEATVATSFASEFPNQCQPFRFFGCDFNSSYAATLFRFPLRSEALAKRSEISRSFYSVDAVQKLLIQLREQLPIMLIFLRNVKTIEVYNCSRGSTSPSLLYKADSSRKPLLQLHNQELLQYFEKPSLVEASTALKVPTTSTTANSSTKKVLNREDFYDKLAATNDANLPKLVTHLDVTVEDTNLGAELRHDHEKREGWRYVVASGLHGGRAKKIACHANTRHLKFVPIGAVAACINHWVYENETKPQESEYNGNDGSKRLPKDIDGQAFCFLPLPVKTGLPVHVNAYFELSSNRRDIWQPTSDAAGEAKLRGEWNVALMKDVIAQLYAVLLQFLASSDSVSPIDHSKESWSLKGQDRVEILRLLPCPLPSSELWRSISTSLLPLLADIPLFWSHIDGGKLIPMRTAVLLEKEQFPLEYTNPSYSGDMVNDGVNGNHSSITMEGLLLLDKLPIVAVARVIFSTLKDHGTIAATVSPDYVRGHFKCDDIPSAMARHPCLFTQKTNHSTDAIGPLSPAPPTMIVNKNAVIYLLQYCVQDISPARIMDAIGLPLIPLQDGSLGRLGARTDALLYLVSDSERRILVGGASRSIIIPDAEIGTSASILLRSPNCSEMCNVQQLQVLDLLKLLQSILPSSWFSASSLVVDRHDIEKESFVFDVSDEWLSDLWALIFDRKLENLISLFEDSFPILPVGYGTGKRLLAKISRRVPVLHPSIWRSSELPPSAFLALQSLGIYVFDAAVLGQQADLMRLSSLLCEPSPQGLLRAIHSSPLLPHNQHLWRAQKISQPEFSWDLDSGNMPFEARIALREMILDVILNGLRSDRGGNGGSNSSAIISAEEKHVLRNFPIWETCVYGAPSTTGTFSLKSLYLNGSVEPDENAQTLNIPPPDIQIELLGPQFIRLRTSSDRFLYEMLGLNLISKADFYANYLIPQVEGGDHLMKERVDELSVQILRILPNLEAEKPGFMKYLSTKKLIKNDGGGLSAATELFDPTLLNLTNLLPRDSFPKTGLYSIDPSLLHALRLLGLGNSLTNLAILRVAVSVHKEAGIGPVSSNTPMEDTTVDRRESKSWTVLRRRGEGLLRHLDVQNNRLKDPDNIEENDSKKADDDLISESKMNSDDTEVSAYESLLKEVGIDIPESVLRRERDVFRYALRTLRWVPALNQPPPQSQVHQGHSSSVEHSNDPAVLSPPWPSLLHQSASSPFASPAVSRSVTDLWLCSAVLRISAYEPQSPFCRALLGWDKPLTGRISELHLISVTSDIITPSFRLEVARQLLALQQHFISIASPPSPSSLRGLFSKQMYLIAPRLWDNLLLAMTSEQQTEVEAWKGMLVDKPIVWIGDQFIEPSRISFEQLAGIDAEPFLFCARGELQNHREVLLFLGAKQRFETGDLVHMLVAMKSSFGVSALAPTILDICLGILKILARFQDKTRGEQEVETEVSDEDNDEGSTQSLSEAEKGPQLEQPKVVDLTEYGTLYIPDTHGVLYAAHLLSVNDAPWIPPAALIQLNQRSGGGLKFVHPAISVSMASLFGCRSLREQLFSGDHTVCPGAPYLRGLIGSDTISDMVGNLISLADTIGSTAIHMVYDGRQHGSESLMYPGLAATKGPALVVFYQGVVLGAEAIVQALSCPINVPSLPDDNGKPSHQSSFTNASAAGRNNGDAISGDGVGYGNCGKRLSSAFTVSDCIEIICGQFFYVFDPCGTHLFASSDEITSVTTSLNPDRKSSESSGPYKATNSNIHVTPKGQKCPIVGASSKDVLSRFPDQFDPLLSLLGMRDHLERHGEIHGMIIRLPIRTCSSAVSDYIPTISQIRRGLRACKTQIESALLFSKAALKQGSIHHILPGEQTTTIDLDITLNEAVSSRVTRRLTMFEDSGWKRSGVLSVFKSFTPTEASHLSKLSVYLGKTRQENQQQQEKKQSAADVASAGEGWLKWRTIDFPGDAIVSETSIRGIDVWLILSIVGAQGTRSLAQSEPFKTLRIPPIVSISGKMSMLQAAELMTSAGNGTEPMPGLLCCGAGNLGTVGFPFHIEGPFIQDFNFKGLVLPINPLEKETTIVADFGYMHQSALQNIARLKPPAPPVPPHYLSQWNATIIIDAVENLLPKLLLEAKEMVSRVAGGDRSRFYYLWPFLPRIHPRAAHIVRSCKMLPIVANQPLFLLRGTFLPLTEVLVDTAPLSLEVLRYLQESSSLRIAHVPAQVGRDLSSYTARAANKFQVLTPGMLRETLRRSASNHCTRLKGKYELLVQLLKFCASDAPGAEETSDLRRKYFKDFPGTPLLPTADGFIRTFPQHSLNRVAIVSPALLALLPQLSASFFHPGVVNSLVVLLRDVDLRQELFVDTFSAIFLQQKAAMVFAPHLRGTLLHRWSGASHVSIPEVSPVLDPNESHFEVPRGTPSPLLVYTLWKDVLASPYHANMLDPATGVPMASLSADEVYTRRQAMKNRQEDQLLMLSDWPLLPVISLNRRLLISPNYLPFVLWSDSETSQQLDKSPDSPSVLSSDTEAQDEEVESKGDVRVSNRVQMIRAIKQIMSSNPLLSQCNDSNFMRLLNGKEKSTAWSWTERSCEDIDRPDPANSPSSGITVEPQNERVSTAYPVENVGPNNSGTVSQGSGLLQAANEFISPLFGRLPEENQMLNILLKLGIPVIDRDFFDEPPCPLPTTVLQGNKLLQALRKLGSSGNGIISRDEPEGQTGNLFEDFHPEYLLNYDGLSRSQRKMLLLDIVRDQSAGPIIPATVSSLRLFTAKETDRAVTADGPGGTYWCTSDDVVEEIHSITTICREITGFQTGGQFSTPSTDDPQSLQSLPTILIDDNELKETVYPLVGVNELTFIEAVRRFTLPILTGPGVPHLAKILILQRLLPRWNLCRADAQLVSALKAVAFIPPWYDTDPSSSSNRSSHLPGQNSTAQEVYSKPSDVFSWKNSNLVTALHSTPSQRQACCFFPPLEFRSGAWYELLVDLGMQSDLDKQGVLRVAIDIEEYVMLAESFTQNKNDGTEYKEVETPSSGPLPSLEEAMKRGRLLLEYLKTSDCVVTFMSDTTVTQRLSQIRFVPVKVPLGMDQGGILRTEYAMTSFNRLLSPDSGALGFTLMPVLDADIAPDPVYSSAFGITKNPRTAVVISHLKNLINAAPLDHWNSSTQFPLPQTFTAIFSALQEKYPKLGDGDRLYLQHSAIVPIGHTLVKTSRLFFRLTEDLSPFMHEVPRHFGPHEKFLKQLGVRECPSREDYIGFLSELHAEAGEQPLNPNELRAVIAIIQLIATPTTFLESSAQQLGLPDKTVFVPDDGSVLRPSDTCIVNDDNWLRDQLPVVLAMQRYGLYVAHPFICKSGGITLAMSSTAPKEGSSSSEGDSLASALGIQNLSDIVEENLFVENFNERAVVPSSEQEYVLKKVMRSMHSLEFAMAVVAISHKLSSAKASAMYSEGMLSSENRHSNLTRILANIDVQLVNELFIRLKLSIPQKAQMSSVFSEDEEKRPALSFARSVLRNADSNNDVPTQTFQVLVNDSLLQSSGPLRLSFAVARSLATILHLPLHAAPVLATVLESCEEHSDLFSQMQPSSGQVLDALRIGGFGTYGETGGNRLKEAMRGVPGALVTETDRLKLELKPFRQFRVGEVVALEVEPTIALIQDMNNLSRTEKLLVYATVVNGSGKGVNETSLEESGFGLTGLKLVPIAIGNKQVINVLSSEIYSFKPVKSSQNSMSSDGKQGVIPRATNSMQTRSSSERKTMTAMTQKSSSLQQSSLADTGEAGEASLSEQRVIRDRRSVLGPVGQNEVREALHGLLTRSGIPVNLDTEDLCSQIINLNDRLQNTQNDLNDERIRAKALQETVRASEAMVICEICQSGRRTHVLVPCGHTFCETCVEKLPRCPFCREAIRSRIRFYIPQVHG